MSMDISRAQYAVLTEGLGVRKLFCVVGFSMGGQQVCIALSRCKTPIITNDSLIGISLGDDVSGFRRAFRRNLLIRAYQPAQQMVRPRLYRTSHNQTDQDQAFSRDRKPRWWPRRTSMEATTRVHRNMASEPLRVFTAPGLTARP